MSYQDRTITCVECGNSFVWTAGEQEFYAQKGFTNEPKRCKPCKAAKNSQGNAPAAAPASGSGYAPAGGTREEHQVTCSNCGKPTTVPFKPILDRPVYCRSCYQERRSSMSREPRL